MEAINKVIADYGTANRNKYRPVVYYLLTKHFGKGSRLRLSHSAGQSIALGRICAASQCSLWQNSG